MCAKTRARHRKLHFTMTRSARRGEKKQALPATPWKEMRSGIVDVRGTHGLQKVKQHGLKKIKKVGKLSKKLLKNLKKKTGKKLTEELRPLLELETLSSDSDGEAGSLKEVRKRKKQKSKVMKSVRFEDDVVQLLESASADDNDDLEVEVPSVKGKRKRMSQDDVKWTAELSGGATKQRKKGGRKQAGEGSLYREEEEEEEKEKGFSGKKEKEREARRARRAKKKVCFNCRHPGHQVSECPEATETGICFKCGAADHISRKCKVKVPEGEFPYAKCFICGEIGHLSRSCPDNPRGLYPKGGGCNACGSVEHMKANCPTVLRKTKKAPDCSLGLLFSNQSADAEDFSEDAALLHTQDYRLPKKAKSRPKIVKF